MDAITPTTARNSRWDREPIIGSDNKPILARLTERDIEIFKLLARYDYLPIDYIQAFVGGSYIPLRRHLNLLSRKPNLYIKRPPQQREHAEANYRKLIYELDDKGAKALAQREYPVRKRATHGHFQHMLLECQIAASFELGVKGREDMQLIQWPAILASDNLPEATRRSSHPLRVEFGNAKEDRIEPDWEPFVVARTDGETRSYVFCPGFEADCDTESLESETYGYNTIRAKFRAYLTIIERGIYRTHYGANTFMVPFVTTSERRMKSMMTLLERMIEEKTYPKEIAKRFIFKHIPGFSAHKETAPATGHMLTEPWKRAGYPDFTFDIKEKGAQ